MAVIVSLCDVIEEMDLMSDEATAYINWKTGELITWARADFEKRAPLGCEALGVNVHSRMEFPSGLCDNLLSFMAQGPLTSLIPPFRPDGYLPEGVYVCSEADVIFRFGSSNRRRRRLAVRLRQWIELGRQVGAKRLLVDGSFVTAKEEPQDVDTVIFLPQNFTQQLEREHPPGIGRDVVDASPRRNLCCRR